MSTLDHLVTENLHRLPHFSGGLCNHQSMAAIAQRALGLGDAELERFSALYRRHLEPAPAPRPISPEALLAARGDGEHYSEWFVFYRRRIDDQGVHATLQRALVALGDGATAAAFHPLIRVAYALLHGDAREVAAGLAYWADVYRTLEGSARASGASPRDADPTALLRLLAAERDWSAYVPRRGLIEASMEGATTLDAFAGAADALAIGAHTVAGLAAAALEVYLARPDVLTLHLVTGAHALRVIADAGLDVRPALRSFWVGLAAVYVVSGRPPLDGVVPAVGFSRRAIVERLVGTGDDHAIKFVFSCLEEERVYGDPRYRWAAAGRVGLRRRTAA